MNMSNKPDRPSPIRPVGRYDDIAEELCRRFRAQCILVIGIGGERGPGFSMSTVDRTMQSALPGILRHVADDIERQLNESRDN